MDRRSDRRQRRISSTGYPYYAVSIALTHGSEITHAVVLDPVRDELFTAIRGKGAQLNGAPIRVSAARRSTDALLGTVVPDRATARRCRRYLPLFDTLSCAAPASAGRRLRARSRHVAAGPARRLLGDEPRAAGTSPPARCSSREAGGRVGDFAGGGEFLRAQRGDRRRAGRLQSAARGDRGGASAVTASSPAVAARRAAARSPRSVTSAITAIASSSASKPAALTTGPSSPHGEPSSRRTTRRGACRSPASASGRRRSARSSRR